MKKSLLALLVLFGVALALMASSPTSTSAKMAAQAATPDTSLSGTIRLGSWDTGPALPYWVQAVQDFQKVYPNVNVIFEDVPNNYGTNQLAEFAAGNAPDVFQIGDGSVATYQQQGVLTDLAPYISGKNGFDPSVSYPAVAAFGNTGGSTYALTKDYSPLVFYYNTDLLKKAGLAAPKPGWTWDDMLKMAQKLTIDANGNDATSANFDPKHIKQWGLQMPDGWGDPLWSRGILPMIYQNGGSVMSTDGKMTTGYMNSDATVAAVQFYVDLVNKYHVAMSKTDVASFSGADPFQSGQAAMLWNGVWPLDSYTKIKGFNFATIGLPAGPKGAANVLCWAGFAMYSGSKNKDAAWALLKYIGVGDGAKQFAAYALTAVQAIAQSQGKTKDPLYGPVMADLANVKPIPDLYSPYWGSCGDKYFGQELATVFASGVSVKDAMTKAASEADACLASQK
jgi:multiple sugar transport system substrate-binding protein